MSTKITTPTFLSFVVPGGVDTVHRSFETGWTADVGRYTATSKAIEPTMARACQGPRSDMRYSDEDWTEEQVTCPKCLNSIRHFADGTWNY